MVRQTRQSQVTGQSSQSMIEAAVESSPPLDRTLRCRYEMKYVISKSKAAAIESFIRHYLELDPFSKLYPDGYYPIVSLYLDSDNMQLCMESLRGSLKRFKLRIRSYTYHPEYPRFVEIKRRVNRIIIKNRARIKSKDMAALLSGQYVPPLDNDKDSMNTIKQFQLYMKSVNAGPKILIRYRRCAYEGKMNNRLRITFDHDLCYRASTDTEVLFDEGNWQPNPETIRNVILEIKFTGRYPAWLGRMATHFNLIQRSMSKYATSVKQAHALKFCAPTLMSKVY
ncbi:VTC domain-containing protein [Planctomycetota bacterium]